MAAETVTKWVGRYNDGTHDVAEIRFKITPKQVRRVGYVKVPLCSTSGPHGDYWRALTECICGMRTRDLKGRQSAVGIAPRSVECAFCAQSFPSAWRGRVPRHRDAEASPQSAAICPGSESPS